MRQAQTLDSLNADCPSGAEHLRLLLQKRDRDSQGPLLLVTFPFCHPWYVKHFLLPSLGKGGAIISPFLSMKESESVSHSVMSNSLRPHGL